MEKLKKINILVTGCSRHSKTLVDCLKNNKDGVEVKVWGCDYNPFHLLRVGIERGYVVPAIVEEDAYIQALTDICKENDIDIILPYITAELPLMARKKEYFESIGVKVSVSSEESLKIANNKIEMMSRFPELMPKQETVHNSEEVKAAAERIGYPNVPLCVKLPNMCGGAGFAVVDDELAFDMTTFNRIGVNRYVTFEHLCIIADKMNRPIILQEYVPGKDYSVCVLADKGRVAHKCGFMGETMEYGSVITGMIEYNEEAYKVADKVVKELGLDGNLCIDFMVKEDGSVKMLEVNPRINATLPFIVEAGVNLPYLRCKQLLGLPFDEENEIKYGLKMNKYFESVYFF